MGFTDQMAQPTVSKHRKDIQGLGFNPTRIQGTQWCRAPAIRIPFSDVHTADCSQLMMSIKYLMTSPMNCITSIANQVNCGHRLDCGAKIAYCCGRRHGSLVKIRGLTQTQKFRICTSLVPCGHWAAYNACNWQFTSAPWKTKQK